jgi:biotin carboxylase
MISGSFADPRPEFRREMTLTETFRTRLASTDSETLRGSGPEADELRRELLIGSRVAVIEPGYVNKRFLYERAAALGVELVLVGDSRSWARGLVAEGVATRYVESDDLFGDPDATASDLITALGEEATQLDGVVTFWENAVPATARIAAALGLPGLPPAAADGARSKLRTLEASRDAGLPTPRFIHLDEAPSLAEAATDVGFPAVIKPVYGAEALGCLRVDDLVGLESGYARVAELITPELNPIFEQGCDLLLEEYLAGPEFDVDFLLSGGACVFSAVAENWPTEEPYFVETGLHTPSAHPPDRVAAMVDLCVRTALALGFRDGPVHAEAKDTAGGPRILELNARLGGGSIVDNHRWVTGVDLLEQQLLVTLGVPVAPRSFPSPACGVATIALHPTRSGTIADTRFLDRFADDPAVIQHDVYVKAGEHVVAASDGFPTVLGELTVHAEDVPAARELVEALVDAVSIPYAD